MAMQALYLLAMLKDAKNDLWKQLNFTLMHGCMGTDPMSVIMMVALRLAISSPEIVAISLQIALSFHLQLSFFFSSLKVLLKGRWVGWCYLMMLSLKQHLREFLQYLCLHISLNFVIIF